MVAKYIIMFSFLLINNKLYCQIFKLNDKKFIFNIAPVGVAFLHHNYNYHPVDIVKSSVKNELELNLNFKKNYSIGIFLYDFLNNLPSGFDYNNIKKFDEFKYKVSPYFDSYNFGFAYCKKVKIKGDYSLGIGVSGGGNMNNFKKYKLPVQKMVDNEYIESISLRPIRSLYNMGVFFSPFIEFRNYIDKDFYIYFRLKYTLQNCKTKMNFIKYNESNIEIYNEIFYYHTKISYCDFTIGFSFNW